MLFSAESPEAEWLVQAEPSQDAISIHRREVWPKSAIHDGHDSVLENSPHTSRFFLHQIRDQLGMAKIFPAKGWLTMLTVERSVITSVLSETKPNGWFTAAVKRTFFSEHRLDLLRSDERGRT